MEVPMSIDVIQSQPQSVKAFKLRVDFCVGLATQIRRDGESQAKAKGITQEPTVGAD
jgi:DNA gyrase inhibitor GyrI